MLAVHNQTKAAVSKDTTGTVSNDRLSSVATMLAINGICSNHLRGLNESIIT